MLNGKGISEGIGIGKVFLLKSSVIKFEKYEIEDKGKEIEKFHNSFNEVIKDIEETLNNVNGTEKEIMEAYLMIIQDVTLISRIEEIINTESVNAEFAVDKGFNEIIKIFENMEDNYLAARALDIKDMKDKILSKLLNISTIDFNNLPKNTIIVANEITTSETANINFDNVSGIITQTGGINSHVAIIARTHEIPAISEVNDAESKFKNNEYIAINGKTGEIFKNPKEEEIKELEKLKAKIETEKEELKKYFDLEAITKDGVKVEIVSNIGNSEDVKLVKENSSEGIGLFRSEFVYMEAKEHIPNEEEQFNIYKKVAEEMKNKIAIIRTLDIGGDKEIKFLNFEKEANPFLGFRAIRFCLENKEIFKEQLRAIIRASAFGNLAIMLPMISSIEEILKSKEIIEEVKEELKEKNIKFNENIKVGIMIEIPAAAIIADKLSKECDFFSIGTNDLIQYTVAVERGNNKISKLYNKFHPAIIKLIKMSIDGAHKNDIFCGMCGEAAGDEKYIPILIGLGLDEFSMNPVRTLASRKIIRNLDTTECKKLVAEILDMTSAEEVEEAVAQFIENK